jgi:hypothetical protein
MDSVLSALPEMLALGPGQVWHGAVLLGAFCAVCYLLRTALMVQAPASVAVHMVVCTLTLLPAIVLAGVLVWADVRHPDRAWLNLGVAAALSLPWWLGGAITRLARPDTEGGDIGWLAMGALITFPVGAVAALIVSL